MSSRLALLPWILVIGASVACGYAFNALGKAKSDRDALQTQLDASNSEIAKLSEQLGRKAPVVEAEDVPDVMKHLAPLLRTENDDARAKAVELAGSIAAKDSVEMLQKIVRTDPSIKVRVVALDVVGRHKLESCRGAALAALAEADPALRRKAAWCLGQLGKTDSPDDLGNTRVALLKALKEEHAQWLDSVTKKEPSANGDTKLTLMPIAPGSAAGRLNPYIQALGVAGDGAVVLDLSFWLDHPDPMVRRETALALGTIGAAESKSRLITRFRQENDSLTQEAIVSALTGSNYKMKYDAKARNFTEPQ